VIYFEAPVRNKSIGEMGKAELAEKQKDLEGEISTITSQLKGIK
jgi:hypothetical protein